jgi:hypothetical protein
MTSPNPMTRDELLESAAADAFGMLDDYEAALYTRSLHHAPATVQNEVLQRQAELVSDMSLMPNVEPHPDLKQRVLDAVAEAVQSESAHLAPLATIGRSRVVDPMPARFAFGAPSQFWRAAAFVLCAGVIVLAYFFADARNWGNQVATLALSNNTDAQLEQLIGPTFKNYLFDATARRAVLASTSGDSTLHAIVYTRENSDLAFLVIEGLPSQASPYTLQITHSDGHVDSLKNFASTGRLSGVQVALNTLASNLKNVRWEITNASGVVLMASV